MTFKKWVFFVGLSLSLGGTFVACAKKDMPEKGAASKKGARGGESKKSGTLRVTGESVETPKEFQTILAVLETSDKGFQKFWKDYFKDEKEIVSPFGAALKKLKAHVAEDKLKIENESCPAAKTQLDILLRVKKEKRAVSVIHLKSTKDCGETDLPNAASFDLKENKILITLYAHELEEGFGRSLAEAKAHASCVAKLDKARKLESVKCAGLGQDHGTNQAFQLSNFEYIPGTELVNAQGAKIEGAALAKVCADDDSKCINFTTVTPAAQ